MILNNTKTKFIKPLRIPEAFNGIQVNYCKNPTCANFGVPALNPVPGRKNVNDGYNSTGGSTSSQVIKCKICDELPTLKSNQGISEELTRMLAELSPEPAPSCSDTKCAHHGIPVGSGKGYYQSYGMTHSGSKRYLCNSCKKTFTVSVKSTLRQRQSDKNSLIFSCLVRGVAMNPICEIAEIEPETLYQRINFFYEQCKAFSAAYENEFIVGKPIRRFYVAVDRQEYTVNWSNRCDKKNVIMRAIGSADLASGYVFGMHLDFDSSLDAAQIEADAEARKDLAIAHPFRRYARLWLKADYTDAVREYRRNMGKRRNKKSALMQDITDEIADTYDEIIKRPDVEAPIINSSDIKLPAKGMQVHPEYTLYGHFLYLKHLFGSVEKVRFFLDQDSGIRGACLSAFCDEIKARKIDAFYVRIKKDLTVNERERALDDSRRTLGKVMSQNNGLTEDEAKMFMLRTQINDMKPLGKWNDQWLLHPFPKMNEPEKMISFLTNLGDYDIDHMARLYLKAGLHSIDNFFQVLRRRVSLFERPIVTPSAKGSWFAKSPYNPEVVMKMLTIYRVYYNYVKFSKKKYSDRKTPAMRLGFTDKPKSFNDIIKFNSLVGIKP